MSTAYVSEYAGRILDVAEADILQKNNVAIGVSSVQGLPFTANTAVVRVEVDSVCSIAFGPNPTATATDARIAPADGVQWFAVKPGETLAVIQNT